jgi:hypothetical protein
MNRAGWFGGDANASTEQFAGSTELDRSTYVVFPPESGDNETAPMAVTQLLNEALSCWEDVKVVGFFQVAEAIARIGAPLTTLEAQRLAEQLGAAKYIRAHHSRHGDSIHIQAWLFDTRTNRELGEEVVRIGTEATGAPPDSIFRRLAYALLFGGAEPTTPVQCRPGASMLAWLDYLKGREALDDWDLERADSLFEAATRHDPSFGHAFLWLAQVRLWSEVSPARWLHVAEQADIRREQLSPQEQPVAAALVALGRGDAEHACGIWQDLAASGSTDFAVWLSYASCLSRDHAVRADRSSPSGFSFRTSQHEALRAYRAAFRYRPSIQKWLRSSGYQPLRRLLYTARGDLRAGKGVPPDTFDFVAYPTWDGDTLALVPFRRVGSGVVPPAWLRSESVDAAVRRQRQTFYDIANIWVAANPQSTDAIEALAVSLEMLRDPTALDTLRRARSLISERAEWVRLATAEVWMQVKFAVPDDTASLRSARILADSLLDTDSNGARDPYLLAGLAALVGRAEQAADFTRLAATSGVPPQILRSAPALLAHAAIGGPSGRIRELERRVRNGLRQIPNVQTAEEAEMEWLDARPRWRSMWFHSKPSIRLLAAATSCSMHRQPFPIATSRVRAASCTRLQ